jgi:hypothetical protein
MKGKFMNTKSTKKTLKAAVAVAGLIAVLLGSTGCSSAAGGTGTGECLAACQPLI